MASLFVAPRKADAASWKQIHRWTKIAYLAGCAASLVDAATTEYAVVDHHFTESNALFVSDGKLSQARMWSIKGALCAGPPLIGYVVSKFRPNDPYVDLDAAGFEAGASGVFIWAAIHNIQLVMNNPSPH